MVLRFRISRPALRTALALTAAFAAGGVAQTQQLIGYVNTRDAEVTGASDILDGQAVLTGAASVTAREHTAPIMLGRGGTVRVCQTSALHLSASRVAEASAPLLFSLDRGAIEIETNGIPSDAIMTPDLRLTVANKGPLDLRLRVARDGDTCVENRGATAPTLNISDPFGETMYQVAAGQHVLFEHGDLHEVVDRESTPCGCPDEEGMSMADALLASGGVGSSGMAKPAAEPAQQAELQSAAQSARRAAEAHPFPAAISEGLAPPAEIPPAAPGAVHAQIADTLSYNAPLAAAASSPARGKAAPEAKVAPVPAKAAVPAPQPPPKKKDPVHVVGRFFKRLFGG